MLKFAYYMDKDKVLDLAKLARISLTDTEALKLSGDFESILKYVGEVKEIATTNDLQPTTDSYPIRNVMREDSAGHESGAYTESILANAPAREGSYIKVKKIL